MFDSVAFTVEVNDLIRKGQTKQAEERMLRTYSELKATNNVTELERVSAQLAHFYSMPETEDQAKAESFFVERERLVPGVYTKLQTATFYFYVVRDFPKTINKVNEIAALEEDSGSASYYSALTLKGEALINLGKIDDASEVLKELLSITKANPMDFPHGDEMNLLEAAMPHRILAPVSREILNLIIPRMRSQEYIERARLLLGTS